MRRRRVLSIRFLVVGAGYSFGFCFSCFTPPLVLAFLLLIPSVSILGFSVILRLSFVLGCFFVFLLLVF